MVNAMNGSRISTQHRSPDGEAPSSRPALERLREKVHRAADEIERLRAENRVLKQRVEELEARPAIGEDEAFLKLDDPDALRAQIEGFIDTIDAYLAEDAPSNDADGSQG